MHRYRQDLDHRHVVEARTDLDHRLDLSRGQDLDRRMNSERFDNNNRANSFNNFNNRNRANFGGGNRNGRSPERAVRDEDEEGVLFFQDCILKPPRNPEMAKNSLSSKPPGCKSISVTRIPDLGGNFDYQRLEDIFRDIFTTNGGPLDFCRFRMGRTCDVRFLSRDSVEMALLVNGYQIVIRDEFQPTIRFTIILNYLAYREDENEFVSQRQMAQKLGLKDGVELEMTPCNAMTIDRLTRKLKTGETMIDNVNTLRYWIEMGRVDNTNVTKFFNMFQIIFDRMKTMEVEKNDLKKKHRAQKKAICDTLQQIQCDADQLSVVFDDTKKQKCWEKLNGKHRKMIDVFSTHSKELHNELSQTMKEYRKEPADREGADIKLKEKEKMISVKDQEVSIQKKTIENLQQQLWEMAKGKQERTDELKKTKEALAKLQAENEKKNKETATKLGKRRRLNYNMEVTSSQIDSVEARILCLVSSLLRCYSEGASLEVIEAYLKSQKVMYEAGEVDSILAKFPQLFCVYFVNENGKNVKKWNIVLKR